MQNQFGQLLANRPVVGSPKWNREVNIGQWENKIYRTCGLRYLPYEDYDSLYEFYDHDFRNYETWAKFITFVLSKIVPPENSFYEGCAISLDAMGLDTPVKKRQFHANLVELGFITKGFPGDLISGYSNFNNWCAQFTSVPKNTANIKKVHTWLCQIGIVSKNNPGSNFDLKPYLHKKRIQAIVKLPVSCILWVLLIIFMIALIGSGGVLVGSFFIALFFFPISSFISIMTAAVITAGIVLAVSLASIAIFLSIIMVINLINNYNNPDKHWNFGSTVISDPSQLTTEIFPPPEVAAFYEQKHFSIIDEPSKPLYEHQQALLREASSFSASRLLTPTPKIVDPTSKKSKKQDAS